MNAFINNQIHFLDIYKLINITLEQHNTIYDFDIDIINQLYSTTSSFIKEQIKCLH